jgi:radical SAM protein with 4Fe4S-binding SPASM domain
MKFPLQHVIFEITQECNLSCLYCYNHWRRKGYHSEPTNFKRTQQTLKKLFETVNFNHISFTGGEPFLADGLKEFVLDCRMKGKGVSIISNGTAAKSTDYQTLCELGVSLFEFPLHSEKSAIHDTLTGKPGSFDKVLESIRFLSESAAEICAIFILTKLNLNSLHQTIAFVEHLGIRRFMLARFNIGGRGIENAGMLVPSLSELRLAFRIANEFAQKSKLRISANVCVPQCIVNPKDYPNIPISLCGSDLTKKPITIDAFGNVRMCNHSPRIIGNIHTKSIDSILTSKPAKAWQTVCPKYCSNCAQWKNCMGGCRAASEQLGKSLNDEDPIIGLLNEENEEKILELAKI